tara:strand:+ start:168 stop:626 length:459 start_codon:yes stop_codon:yes gene_type:complete
MKSKPINYYLFINSDQHNIYNKKVSGYSIANYRLKNNIYPLRDNTKHKNQLNVGDKYIFYLSGTKENCKTFISYGSIKEVTDICSYNESSLNLINNYQRFVKLDSNKIINFKKIIDLKDGLSFVPKKNNWGYVLQGGIVKINKNDYDLIVCN